MSFPTSLQYLFNAHVSHHTPAQIPVLTGLFSRAAHRGGGVGEAMFCSAVLGMLSSLNLYWNCKNFGPEPPSSVSLNSNSWKLQLHRRFVKPIPLRNTQNKIGNVLQIHPVSRVSICFFTLQIISMEFSMPPSGYGQGRRFNRYLANIVSRNITLTKKTVLPLMTLYF